jgi:nitrogen fixation/metabolism regulation signal transduction histidine kinase
VVTNTQYYATALVLAVAMVLTMLDAVRLTKKPAAPIAMPLSAEYRNQVRQSDQMAALLDAVTVALIAINPEGKITFANRAARLLAGEDVARLADIRALGADAARALLALPAGSRQIMTMADGGSVLAWTGAFTTPEQGTRKLISLQIVMGELDAVQLRSWQDMTRVLSHEMMNSLTPISSLSESLPDLLRSRGNTDKDIADAVETIGRRSQHLMNFVERYRQIATLPEPNPRAINLADFMADIGALLRPGFEARGIRYEAALAPENIVLRGDPELLNHAIINLLYNAADAVQNEENPAIAFSCAAVGSNVIFAVSDNGVGIPPHLLQDIFVPFFSTKVGGSGIGLALARQIAQAHRGQLEALPRHGGGMIFKMTIPWDTPSN